MEQNMKEVRKCLFWAIPLETTQFLAEKSHGLRLFSPSSILVYVGPIRVHNPEYQPPLTLIGHNFLVYHSFFDFIFEGLSSTSGQKIV